MSLSISITGIDALYKKLNRAKGIEILEVPMQESVLKLQADMKEYPSPIALRTWVRADGTAGESVGQAYRRTGTLGRRWTKRVERSATGLTGRVGNNTSYAPFVQSHVLQAGIHAGRWQTDKEVLENRRPWIIARFKRAIDRALEGK